MSQINQPRRPFRKVQVQFEPVDPNAPPATPGPLIVVRRPLVRLEAQFEPVDIPFDGAVEVASHINALFRELNELCLLHWDHGLSLERDQQRRFIKALMEVVS